MSKAPRENRIPIMMSDDELKSIDDWRFANRIGTRADAVRRLMQIGLRYDAHADAAKEAVYHSFDVLMNLPQTIVGVGEPVRKDLSPEEVGKLALERLPDIVMATFDAVNRTAELATEVQAMKQAEIGEALQRADDARKSAEEFNEKAREVHKKWMENIK